MSYLGSHRLKVRFDLPQHWLRLPQCWIPTFQPSNMIVIDLTVSPSA